MYNANVSRTETPEAVPIDTEYVVNQKHDTHILYDNIVNYIDIALLWHVVWQHTYLWSFNE